MLMLGLRTRLVGQRGGWRRLRRGHLLPVHNMLLMLWLRRLLVQVVIR